MIMKRTLFVGLATLAVSTAVSTLSSVPAQATPVSYNPNMTQTQAASMTPFDLVTMAYRGALKDIPGYQSLSFAYLWNRVSAKDLVQKAVDSGLLSSDVLNDRGYLFAVDSHLRSKARLH